MLLRHTHRSLARSIGCALALSVAVGTLGANAASATPVVRHLLTRSASSPRPKQPRRPTRTRKVVAKKKTTTVAEAPTLPVIPSLVQMPVVDGVLQPGPTPTESFAAMPVAPAPAPTSMDGRPLAAFSASAERMLSNMVDRARSQLGTRYVFGGTKPGKGLDCSAFARFAMEALGISLPRTAAQQARVGSAVPRDRKMLKPGDLLTFGRGSRVSHVGIYLGEGRFIHASVTSGQIIETTIDRNARLFRRWQGARRILATDDTTAARGDG